jgi:hypothetical protein
MYHFRLQRTDGTPADPPTYRSFTLNWRQGDKIPLTAERTLRVLGVHDDDADQPPALVVEAHQHPSTAATNAWLEGNRVDATPLRFLAESAGYPIRGGKR